MKSRSGCKESPFSRTSRRPCEALEISSFSLFFQSRQVCHPYFALWTQYCASAACSIYTRSLLWQEVRRLQLRQRCTVDLHLLIQSLVAGATIQLVCAVVYTDRS